MGFSLRSKVEFQVVVLLVILLLFLLLFFEREKYSTLFFSEATVFGTFGEERPSRERESERESNVKF